MAEPARQIPETEETEPEPPPLHEQGLSEWFDALPPEDWSTVLNEDELTPVKWVDGVGFVEVPA